MKTSYPSPTLIARSLGWSGIFLMFVVMGVAMFSHAETAPGTSVSTKQQATVIPVQWSAWQKEADSDFVCSGNTVLIGRAHTGDENGQTQYQCGTVSQFGRTVTVSERIRMGGFMEEDSGEWNCPANKVMTGRHHEGDEQGDTWYECSKLTGELGELQAAPGAWSPSQKESESRIVCPADTVMVGRYHMNDENGPTRHQCAGLY